MKPLIQRIFLFTAISWPFYTTTQAATVTISSIADTALFENAPNNNLGAVTFMPIGTTGGGQQSRGLVRFDVSGNVPNGAKVSAVTVAFVVSQAQGGSAPIFDLHRMLVSWIEGDNTGGANGTGSIGSTANAGEPSWNNRAAPSTAWGTPGCLAGIDFVATSSASHNLPVATNTFNSTAALVADVQEWLDNPESNFGWLLKAQNEVTLSTACRVTSHEVVARAPKLTITYSLAPQLKEVTRAGSDFQFKFGASSGIPYQVQRRDNLAIGLWVTFTNVGPLAVSGDALIVDELTTSNMFYRVVAP